MEQNEEVIYLTEDFIPVDKDDPRMVMVKVRQSDGKIVFGFPVIPQSQSIYTQGGRGSGNFGHRGRVGKIGGSSPKGTVRPGTTTSSKQQMKISLENMNPRIHTDLTELTPEQLEDFLVMNYQTFQESLGINAQIHTLNENDFNSLVIEEAATLGVDPNSIRGYMESDLDGSNIDIYLRQFVVRGGMSNQSGRIDKDEGAVLNNIVRSHEIAMHEIGHAYKITIDKELGKEVHSMNEYEIDEHESFANKFSDVVVDGFWHQNQVEEISTFLGSEK